METTTDHRRRSVNVASFLATCFFLFVAVQLSDGVGNFASKINSITASLDKAVLGLNTDVNYTDYEDQYVYYSNSTFNARGMTGLYNLTKMFISAIVPSDILMKGLIYVENGYPSFGNPPIADIAKYYSGLLAMVIFLILCVLLFPIFYLFFCCCRCCGNCGGRSQPADKKKDLCKKLCQGTLLILLSTGLLFCIVCAFVSNEQLKDGIKELPSNLKNSVQDTKTFLASTNDHVNMLLVKNYGEFSKVLVNTLEESSSIVVAELENYSNATAMLNLREFAVNLQNVSDSMIQLDTDIKQLKADTTQLNDSIRGLKSELMTSLTECKNIVQMCTDVYNNVTQMEVTVDFSTYLDSFFPRLPNISENIEEMKKLNINQIKQATEQGEDSLNAVKEQISKSLQEGIDSAIAKINSSGIDIQKSMNNVTSMIDKFRTMIDDSTKTPISRMDDYIADYGVWQYYVGLAISCVLLLVTICIALGLICGICGKRPDGYSDNCCNKGAGSQFLICAVTIMFIFGFIISVVTLVASLVGMATDRIVCTTLRESDSDTQIMQLLDKLVQFGSVNTSLSGLLQDCRNNQSLYRAFNLESQFNITDIKSQFDINAELNKFTINDSMLNEFSILNESSRTTLQELEKFTPINFDKFSEIGDDFLNMDMNKLSTNLTEIINALESKGETDLANELSQSRDKLDNINRKLMEPIKENVTVILDNVNNLDKALKMGYSSFNEAINVLLKQIETAQEFLRVNGTGQLKNITDSFKDSVFNIITGYMDRVEHQLLNEVGTCGRLSLVVDATLASTCDKILLPMNGFWFSLFWTIILYIVSIVVAVKLANLYQKYKPYGQGYVETEYLYDAYADSIPLNSRGGKRGKKKGKKPKRYEDRQANVGHGPATRGSHPVDGRYDDMAPKHWEDFPNGGPPHYHRAPTEYERPPPYYYPGATGDH